ncbi:MAG: hypothetical protein RLZZ399_357 [Verrucomicrobiota bacterium]|jgi:mono/diheme cytochrome c family protein
MKNALLKSCLVWFGALAWSVSASAAVPSGGDAAKSVVPNEQAEYFESKVRPLLSKHCTECHGEKKQKGDLRLDLKGAAMKGGESGPPIVPGNSGKSLMLQRILSTKSDEKMPPKGERVSEAEVAILRGWIDSGAPWPEGGSEAEKSVDKRLSHWSFQPVKVDANSPGSIDAFIDAKLQGVKLSRSPEASRRTLIRRLSYDLVGLPPTPEEIDAFVSDSHPKAYEQLVDRLLASERFGEKWARHWLDVVRFAESHGFEMNQARPNAWPYRDYVIRALNEDKPFDQFVREQLAGDQLGQDAATGFLVGGAMDQVRSADPVLSANQRADELHDMVSTTAATFLGLTVNCARCHDHKFDPILAKDYYAMTALIQGTRHGERPMRTQETEERLRQVAALRRELAPVEAALRKVQPYSHLGRIVCLDDSSDPSTAQRAGVTQIEQPRNGEPIVYTAGNQRGQAGDLGDVVRLPNLGRSYREWSPRSGAGEKLFTWDPRVSGRYRIWISWSVAADHTLGAKYVMDRDGDLSTTGDQKDLAEVNQRTFADGTAAIAREKRWSGFFLAGEQDLTPQSVLLLKTGAKGGVHTADLVVFEEVIDDAKPGVQPPLRAPVVHLANEEHFAPQQAKYVRLTVTKTNGAAACIDELEVFGTRDGGRNLAASQNGTVATASGVFLNGENPKHQIAHVNDGVYGNDRSWIGHAREGSWVQLEFRKPEEISRIVWSRDRRADPKVRAFEDRLAEGYRIEVSMDGLEWKMVAHSGDRLGASFRGAVSTIPTITKVPEGKVAEVAAWTERRVELLGKIQELSKMPMVYAGVFSQPGPTHRNFRGDPMQPRETVTPGALSLIGKPMALDPSTPEAERRMALAEWIVDPANPLTARVIVNRLWHYHFGTGLVETPSDFGINGARPSHPELLDWLAHELVTHQWSLKHIHRLIVLSGAYRQSSDFRYDAAQVDSGSRLLWRFPPRRIDAEAVRDTILAVSGQLDLKMGGPGFDLFEPNQNYVKVYVTKKTYGPSEFRRMVYQSKPRTMLDDLFGVFDCPDAGQPAPKRNASITPLQALNLLNSDFSLQQSGFLAERLVREAGKEPADQVKRAYQLAFGRVPTPEEVEEGVRFITQSELSLFCRALLNSNEFIRLN